MRLPPETISQITGRKRVNAQVEWFQNHLKAAVPFDRYGPIVTQAAYEALVARACGLRSDPATIAAFATERPKLHLRAVRR